MRAVLLAGMLLGVPSECLAGGPGTPAAAIVQSAVRAIEGDSAARMTALWRERVAANPSDRLARLGLATIDRLAYRYAAADSVYLQLAAAPIPDDVTRAALLGAAWGAYARGLPERADPLFERARLEGAEAHDRMVEGEALIGLSILRASTRGIAVGLALLTHADSLVRGDERLEVEVLGRLALLHAVRGDATASGEAARAAARAHHIGDRREEALALRSLALDQRLHGAEDAALRTLAQVERLQIAAHDHSPLAETLRRDADIRIERSELGAARDLVARALGEANRSGNLFAVSASTVGLGSIALATQDYPDAHRYLDDAAQQYVALHDSAGLATANGYRARLGLATGDLAHARATALAVLAFHRTTHDVGAEFDILRTLVAIERRLGDWDAAAHWLRLAAARAPRGGVGAREVAYDRGALALARGDPVEAATQLRRFLATPDTADRIGDHAAREMLAAALARRGELAGAEREMTRASDELDAWRATLSDRSLRVLAFQIRSRDAEVEMPAAAEVIAALAAGGRAEAALLLAERRRARELADAMVRTRTLDGTRPVSASAPVRAAPLSLAALATLLTPSTRLVEYVTGTGGTPSTRLVVSLAADRRVSVSGARLPSADSLADQVARLTVLAQSGVATDAPAASLGRLLIEDVVTPATRALIVVPDGPLHRLPFDLLRAGGVPLLARVRVSVAPSAAVALALRRARAPAVRGRLLAFADPRDAADASPRPALTAHLPALPAAREEVTDVARYFSSATVRLGADATAASLRAEELGRYDVLHFATHALIDDADPARTGLVLAATPSARGFVSAGELAGLKLGARLVVLSACRTADGALVEGEGVQGLTAPLLQAGAHSIVATFWPVNDAAAARIMHDFYGGLARGLGVADALRSAKQAAWARHEPARDWAAFTLVGNPVERVPLLSPASAP